MDWMLLPFRRYADFSGRSRRMEFWMFSLLNLIVYAILVGVSFSGFPWAAILAEDTDALASMPPMSGVTIAALALLGIWALAIIIPSIAVTVRRLHDRDMSGWWYLGLIVLSLIPVVGFIASIAMLVLMVLPGTAGPNRFGNDPKDIGNAGVFA